MSKDLFTKIGLEIHVQLATKSKMFCGCDNNAEGKAPNTVVCPVCLALPGSLPVANEQAILWTIKTGLALNCEIGKISKFDRKHYFYPDLPKGYQISQYDEPFCIGGFIETDGEKVRLNRIHLEEDAGKLIHRGGKSLVDLNRAGTPLMEIVTEPDITSPKQAGDFLRKLQKIVRDVVKVSEASMEKGHMRCDANISVNDGEEMSPIVELKNINSFRFVEKALTLVEAQLRNSYGEWPGGKAKETWGYNSENNTVYLQRRKEEAADYRYFPEPDLPPIDTTKFDLEILKSQIGENEEDRLSRVTSLGIVEDTAKVLLNNSSKEKLFFSLIEKVSDPKIVARVVVHNEFGFQFSDRDFEKLADYANAINFYQKKNITKSLFGTLAGLIHDGKSFEEAKSELGLDGDINIEETVESVLKSNPKEVERYRAGERQLLGFFVGQVMKETKGKASPSEVNQILTEKL